jgi:hypothetical protein
MTELARVISEGLVVSALVLLVALLAVLFVAEAFYGHREP